MKVIPEGHIIHYAEQSTYFCCVRGKQTAAKQREADSETCLNWSCMNRYYWWTVLDNDVYTSIILYPHNRKNDTLHLEKKESLFLFLIYAAN